jgi:hypothetical protein
MGVILNFKDWKRVYEDVAPSSNGSEPADIVALDKIQKVADMGPRKFNRFLPQGKQPAAAETLITTVGTTAGAATQMGLSTGQPYKIITFKTSDDPGDPKVKKNIIKAIFFAEGGVLKATIYKNNVLIESGDVTIKSNGSFDQITQIGSLSTEPLVAESGVEAEYNGFAAPIAAGIASLIPANSQSLIAAACDVPRGGSNVVWTKDTSALNSFVAAERAKAAVTPTQRP